MSYVALKALNQGALLDQARLHALKLKKNIDPSIIPDLIKDKCTMKGAFDQIEAIWFQ